MTLSELRKSPLAAWAGPLFIFMAVSALRGLAHVETAGAPWYRAWPEHWIYPLQTLCGLAAVAFWWRHYTFRPLTGKHALLAAATGTVGIACWLLPGWLFLQGHVPEIPWLGCLSRTDGFDPNIWHTPGAWWTAVILRFLRMVVCVALVEELFWRGFAWRALSDEYREFHTVPFALPGWKPLLGTVLAIVLIHNPTDYAGALPWGLLTGWLYLQTRSVGALVVCHAVANLLLGLYVMRTGQWGYW